MRLATLVLLTFIVTPCGTRANATIMGQARDVKESRSVHRNKVRITSEYCRLSLRGCEEINSVVASDTTCRVRGTHHSRQVVVRFTHPTIFSQPLRESTHFRGAKGDIVFPAFLRLQSGNQFSLERLQEILAVDIISQSAGKLVDPTDSIDLSFSGTDFSGTDTMLVAGKKKDNKKKKDKDKEKDKDKDKDKKSPEDDDDDDD